MSSPWHHLQGATSVPTAGSCGPGLPGTQNLQVGSLQGRDFVPAA